MMTAPDLERLISIVSKGRGPGVEASPLQVFACRDFDVAAREWAQLDDELGHPSLFSSWLWTETWLKHYGDLIPHRWLIGRRGVRTRAICLVTEGVGQTTGPFPVRTAHVGTAGEPDGDSVCIEYNQLAATADSQQEFAAGVWDHLLSKSQCEILKLDGMLPESIAEFSRLQPDLELRDVPVWYFDLRQARESKAEVLTHLSQSGRSKIRRTLKQCDAVQLEWAETPAAAESIFADLVRLHQARWNVVGERGAFASRRFLCFHREMIERLLPSGRAVLCRVCEGSRVLGCHLAYVEQQNLLLYQSGYETFCGKFSPGVVTDYHFMLEALRRGFDEFNFLAGDYQHKRRLATHFHRLVWATWKRPSVKLSILESLRTLKRTIAQGLSIGRENPAASAREEHSQIDG